MNTCLKKLLLPLLAIALAATDRVLAEPVPTLRLQTIQMVPGGPLEFIFHDEGTGATIYHIEHSLDLGGETNWSPETTAVITPLGEGRYQVVIPAPEAGKGFFRVAGTGPSGEDVILEFSSTAFQITEGDTISQVITFSAPFTGTLHYTISGTATSDDYEALSGEIQVFSSTSAIIPITVSENATIDPHRIIILTLEAVSGTQLGLTSRAVITIEDQDARWEGALSIGGTSLPFSLEIIRMGNNTEGSLVGGASDFFSEGSFPAAITTHDATAFVASIHGIPLPGGATLLELPVEMSVSLSANHGEEGHQLGDHFISGDAVLVTSYAGQPQLTTTSTGSFLMQRVPAASTDTEVELIPVPAP